MTKRKSLHVRVWEFWIKPGKRKAFERIYGPEGEWVQLFRKGRGYRGTVLLRDVRKLGRYVTLDYWASEKSYEIFRRKSDREFKLLDEWCESLTERETILGSFSTVP